MPKLHIAFLWHMHQPNYRDPVKGYYTMPWVRLHATKAYYDMARLAQSYPEMGLTFNLVPSLLEQLDDYSQGAQDFENILSRCDPANLSEDEKEAVLNRFFQANTNTMIRPLPRLMELLQYRGEVGTWHEMKTALREFAAQDYLDLQVLFNLCWFGFSARDEDEEIRRLIRKGRHYTIEDRDLILEKQQAIINALIPLYRSLRETDAIDIVTSPFNHPILPLLCDTSIAREGMPGCLLPKKRFQFPEDAVKQVEMGLDYMEDRFGERPAGMWPSEGSVSPQALEILHNAGVRWAATDEGILAKSIRDFKRERDLYHPWDAHGVTMFFRNLRLSDQIGFVYSRNTAEVAVDDFISRLRKIAASVPKNGNHIVSVILDGENAWEYFPNSGKEFLTRLYERILSEKDIEPVTFTRYLDEHPPESRLESIFPGSWINSNFDTWMGDQEEADGWDALKNARDLLVEKENYLLPEDREEAWLEIYRAEGSDWFWWYGEDHTSPNDPEFDRLFRAHLERVYNLLGVEVPGEIREPIIRKQAVRADVEPTGLITPAIDGKMTTFYEWLSAGWFPAAGPEGAMSGGEAVITDIYYGFDLESLYFRFDPVKREEPVDLSAYRLAIEIQDGTPYRIELDFAKPDSFLVKRRSKERWVRRTRKTTVAVGKIAELGVNFKDLAMKAGDKGFFSVLLYDQNGMELERLPKTGTIAFTVPDVDYQSYMWQL